MLEKVGFVMPEKFLWRKLTAIYGNFVVEPLERGYATTLGNSLRRVLLSSIPGYAITQVKIEGAQHELSTLKGIVEDVPEIVNNLKHVVIKLYSEGPETLTINVEEEGEVRANDIKGSENVEILNPHLHIATISSGGKLKAKMIVESGKGFLLKEETSKRDAPIGTIFLDPIFSPIKRVNYSVENTRIGERTDYEKLVMEIWTNGVVPPQEALKKATKILIDHFNFISGEEVSVKKEVQEELGSDILKKSIDEFDIPERIINVLHSHGLNVIGDIVGKTEKEFIELKNFGKKSLEEIKKLLEKLNLSLKEEGDEYET